MKTPLIIEQHFHGAFGVDFNKANMEEILYLANRMKELGFGGFFPTLVTDSVENIKRQISIIKKAAENCSEILGIHLEGIFINPLKKGIHNPEHFMDLTVENYKKFEDDFIRIITLAPELDVDLMDYLSNKDVKLQAGHCVGGDLNKVQGVTHTFNAMSGISHRESSTALSALINDNVYTEIIADGVHVSDDVLKLLFKSKPKDKILLISDSLPITNSDLKETIFADSKIFYDGKSAKSADGTIAGSTTLIPQIIKRLAKINLFEEEFVTNSYDYHNLEPKGYVEWNEDYEVVNIVRH